MRILLIALLLISCNSQPKKVVDKEVVVPVQNKDEKFVFLSVGFPHPKSAAQDSIERKWGIEECNLGCVVHDGLLDSVAEHNAKVKAALAAKYGKDWEARYEGELVGVK